MAKKKILVARKIFPDLLAQLAERFDVQSNQADDAWDAATLADKLCDKHGLLGSVTDRVDQALLDRCPHLQVVSNIAVGYNHVDVAACTRRSVLVTNTPGVLDDATADLTWALILATARRVTEAEAFLRAGKWNRWKLDEFLGVDVHHATLGIVGMGRIGQAVAKRARGFDMSVIYHNRKRADPATEAACNARYVGFEELLRTADFVSLNLPYSRESHHLIGAKQIALMKPTALLVNSARGGIVDDAALVDALKRGVIAGAGLDVFENEPALHRGFLDLSNVVLLPHIGSATLATRRKMVSLASENLVAALEGGRPACLVNPEAFKG